MINNKLTSSKKTRNQQREEHTINNTENINTNSNPNDSLTTTTHKIN
jgi:hypothetical protein